MNAYLGWSHILQLILLGWFYFMFLLKITPFLVTISGFMFNIRYVNLGYNRWHG